VVWVAWGMILAGLATFISLTVQNIQAPYGRYVGTASKAYGFLVPGKLAWILQECPCVFTTLYCIYTGYPECLSGWANRILLGLFLLHYTQRSFVFPLLIRGGKDTPVVIFLLAFMFCLINGLLQSRYLTRHAIYGADWLTDPRFLIGVALFFAGMYINIQSDSILRNLRKPGETGYKIPKGGMFEYVSGANFFGEIVEWTGFAVASWSLPGLAFALFTFCGIGPRGVQHHQYYLSKFKDEYPRQRKGVIPFLW